MKQKKLFNSNTKNNFAAKGTNNFTITPDWNSLSYNNLYYTDALLTKANASINRKGNYSSELYFINVDGVIKNVLFTIFKHKQTSEGNILEATIFFNDLDGKFIDGYKIENGLFTKRLVPSNKVHIQEASFFSLALFPQSTIGDNEIFWCDGGMGGNLETVWLGTISNSNNNGSSSDQTYQDFINSTHTQNDTGNNIGGSGAGTGMTPSGLSTATGTILTNPPIDTNDAGNCPPGYAKNPITQDCEYKCGDGKVYNPATSNCECPDGYIEDVNGKCAPEPNKIIIDSTFENSLANCVYKLLKDNNQLNQILDKLIPENSKYSVTFQVRSTSGNGGSTIASYGVLGNITVTINKDLVDTGNIVSIAETILHESVHARLYEIVKSIGGLDKLKEFIDEDSEIGKLAACYNQYRDKERQHEFIWQNYIDEIANGTEVIHALFPNNYTNFHNNMQGIDGYTKETFYQSVAKAGLNKTSYFKNLDSSTQTNVKSMYEYLKANGKKITNSQTCQ